MNGQHTYQPLHRRPIAHLFRQTADHAVRGCLRYGIHPDRISYASLVLALGSAGCFLFAAAHPWLLLPATLLIYGRLWLNMLDGMVALASGQASRRGEVINDLPDRLADVVIFLGVAHSGLCQMNLAYWALITALLVAYVGTLGQAVGAGRQYGGWMSKPWRMVCLHGGAWLTGWQLKAGLDVAASRLETWTALDAACLLILLGGLSTLIHRLQNVLKTLDASAQS